MVVLNNLPNKITYAQVMEGVTGLGGISRVIVKPEPAAARKDAWCAVVHFKTCQAAKDYFLFFKEKPLFFEDKEGELHQARMLLYEPDTPSDDANCGSHSGRCLDFDQFFGPAIWPAMQKIGLSNIVRVAFSPEASGDLGELAIEVTDVAHASRVRQMAIEYRSLPGFSGMSKHLADGPCESDFPPSHILKHHSNIIPFVESNHLETKWNRTPYNTWKLPKFLYPEANVSQTYQATLTDIPNHDAMRMELHVSVHAQHPDAVVMSLQHTIYTSQCGSVCKVSVQSPSSATEVGGDELTKLQDATVGNEDWASFWAQFMRQPKELSPDKYAAMIQHRRMKAEGIITCPDDCNVCKPDIRKSPVPLRARMYTMANDDGYIHKAWLRKDDEETRRSIRPMTPQMGRILRSR